jgi:hypothetical protein
MEKEFRRRAPRRKFNGKAGTLYQGQMSLCLCAQLGEGGALIHTNKTNDALEEGEFLVLTLFLPNIGGIVATAECVYRTNNGKAGLQFTKLSTSYKKKIREFVSRRKAIEVD